MSDDTRQMAADRLREAAALLAAQDANPFRVGAYRRAADGVEVAARPLEETLAQQGIAGLQAIPGVGPSIAAAIAEIVDTGHWRLLDRLRGEAEPAGLFSTIPGIGPKLAGHIHDALGIETLEALEVAAHDGRLAGVPGIGERRAAIIRATLATMLARRRPLSAASAVPGIEPPVELLLDVDAEYRGKAAADALPRIAPRRMNPSGEAWLPILHCERGPWHFTALFSNTPRCHELGHLKDWVVIYFQSGDQEEGQRTVVTETHGGLVGRRVVRGRERECRGHYLAGAPGSAGQARTDATGVATVGQ